MRCVLLARADEVIEYGYAALHESAFGTKQTCPSRLSMSAFGGKADNIFLRAEERLNGYIFSPWSERREI